MSTAASLDNLKSIASADVLGKRVLVRADLNVPMAGSEVSDATRIERFLPTVRDLTSRGAKVIILSHLGRPKGKPEAKYSLRPVADKLASLMPGTTVVFGEDCIGPQRRSRRSPAPARADRLSGEPALPRGRGEERSGIRGRSWPSLVTFT